MELSVIIVSYNVKHFLEQCLNAVIRSADTIRTEIIVVDNNSVDGSVQMVREKFPQVFLIANHSNNGFAKANNQGIVISRGKYVLLVNPDTVVQEDTFLKCIEFMESHPEAGSLGVKMIDGKGRFLPESKRAFPAPEVAFYKIFGFSALFPRSRKFGRYSLGYLDRESVHEVDVISGAFMFIRRTALDKSGLLDEDFFMYGEDIDLSYRIKESGYLNYYYPETAIIHYKGESTKKSSINYVVMFYQAMIIFARKHFSKNAARYYAALIQTAIYFRAVVSITVRFFTGIINPLLNALIVYACYCLFLPVWAKHLFGINGSYPREYLYYIVPAYILVWTLSIYFSGGYEKLVRPVNLLKGVLTGTIIILIVYALLPEHLRFSRALILIGTVWMFITALIIRLLLSQTGSSNFKLELRKRKKRMIIVGSMAACKRVLEILNQNGIKCEFAGCVHHITGEHVPDGYIGHIGQIEEIAGINRIEEIIFCSRDLTSKNIIKTMLLCTGTDVEFKIAQPESLSIIGSSSVNTTGDLYVVHSNTLSRRLNRRKKRLLDIAVALILVLISPVMMFIVKNPRGYLRNIGLNFLGFTSWVSYCQFSENHPGLPGLKTGVLTPADGLNVVSMSPEALENLNLLYAKDYSISNDISIILRSCRYLGRKPGSNPAKNRSGMNNSNNKSKS
ncbi:MAG: glycosyltransferase [Bacteroidales bacterium]|nr:glycosyltransferase [Bacteroidales bacterium]